MDFDHRNPKDKLHKIGPMRTASNGNLDTLLNEIAKCDIVCANCHRIRTYENSQHGT